MGRKLTLLCRARQLELHAPQQTIVKKSQHAANGVDLASLSSLGCNGLQFSVQVIFLSGKMVRAAWFRNQEALFALVNC